MFENENVLEKISVGSLDRFHALKVSRRELPRDPAGAWWDERVERTLMHTLKRASKAGADSGDVAAGRELLSGASA